MLEWHKRNTEGSAWIQYLVAEAFILFFLFHWTLKFPTNSWSAHQCNGILFSQPWISILSFVCFYFFLFSIETFLLCMYFVLNWITFSDVHNSDSFYYWKFGNLSFMNLFFSMMISTYTVLSICSQIRWSYILLISVLALTTMYCTPIYGHMSTYAKNHFPALLF